MLYYPWLLLDKYRAISSILDEEHSNSLLVERNRGTGLSRKHEPWHKKSALQTIYLNVIFEEVRRFQEIAFELQEIAF